MKVLNKLMLAVTGLCFGGRISRSIFVVVIQWGLFGNEIFTVVIRKNRWYAFISRGRIKFYPFKYSFK